jgi:outer membrane cobalamin receptor
MRKFDNDQDMNIYSVAAEYEVSPFESLGLVAGYSHHWLKKDSEDPTGSESEGTFLAGAQYDLFKSTSLHGSASRKVRFPSISQLYDEAKGNPDLQTEKSYNYELGIVQSLPGKSSLSLTGFYINVSDFIKKDEDTQINENMEKYRFRGVEVAAETRPVSRLLLRAGYTYMDSEDRAEQPDYDELQYTPRDKLTFEGSYKTPFGLSAYFSVLHLNRQYYYAKKAPFIKRKLNEYTLVNLRLSQSLFRDRLEIYCGANNLFDKDYETSYGLPQAGRLVYTGIKVSF